MKKLIVSFALACAAVTAVAAASHADTNPQLQNSMYCRNYSEDVICMGPEMRAMRTKIMAMTKEKAMENRSRYCRNKAVPNDPICEPKMMTDTAGY